MTTTPSPTTRLAPRRTRRKHVNVQQAFYSVAKNALKKTAVEEDVYIPGQLVDLQSDTKGSRRDGCC